MGILDRLFKRRDVGPIEDDVLGTLTRSRRRPTWIGTVPLRGIPDRGLAHIEMSGTDAGPDDAARADALALIERWEALIAADIPDALIEVDAGARDGEPTRSVHDRATIFEAYALRSVRLQSIGSGAHVEIGFRIADDEDHHLTVHFANWKPAGCSVDS